MKYRSTLFRYSGYVFLLPYLVLFCAFLIVPLCYGLGLGFFDWEMISPFPPKFVGIGNYEEALTSPYFWKALWATIRFVIMIVPSVVLGALLIALLVNNVPQKQESFFRASFFFPTIISISVAGILWRWFYNTEFGVFNSYLQNIGIRIHWLSEIKWAMKSIVLMTLWWTLGGAMVVLLAGLKQIPDQYYEAAAIDGANAMHRFFYITLPLLKPVLLFVIVMSIIGSFQVFGQTFMITRGGPELSTRVLVQYIYETAFTNYRMGYGAAMSWLLFLVIAVFSLIQFRLMKDR